MHSNSFACKDHTRSDHQAKAHAPQCKAGIDVLPGLVPSPPSPLHASSATCPPHDASPSSSHCCPFFSLTHGTTPTTTTPHRKRGLRGPRCHLPVPRRGAGQPQAEEEEEEKRAASRGSRTQASVAAAATAARTRPAAAPARARGGGGRGSRPRFTV